MIVELNFFEVKVDSPGITKWWYHIVGTKVGIPSTSQIKYMRDLETALADRKKSSYVIDYDPDDRSYHMAVTFATKNEALLFKLAHF
jgi:hypothetical protein